MPLPASNQPWPPIDPGISAALADWSAWYSGSPDELADRYLNRAVNGVQDRPSQYRGGVWGRFVRWWWGQPTPLGEKRAKLHIPLAGDIARTSSELLFAEPPKLTADDQAAQKWLDAQVETGLRATLLESGEVCAALGGVYPRLVWDTEIAERPWIAPVHADGALPVFAYGRLREVAFWTVLEEDDQRVVRHLELHTRGHILHGLYEGTPTSLGKRIDLNAFDQTRPFAATDGVIETGAPDHLTSAYVPNMRPAKAWRCVPDAAYWGQSDYAGIEGIMDALDEVYSSLMRDVRIAKGRIIVPTAYLRNNGPGQGGSWDEDREVYSGLDMLVRGDSGATQFTTAQFKIRVTEHLEAARGLIEQAVRQAGYSAASFGEMGDGAAVTATEILTRERRTMLTRARKSLYWETAIADIMEAKAAVEKGPLFHASDVQVARPKVEFQDSIQESISTLANTVSLLNTAEAASRETLVRLLHPDWDEPRVKQEVDAILGETGRATADPFQTGNEQPPPGPPTPPQG